MKKRQKELPEGYSRKKIVPIKKHLAKFLMFENWDLLEYPNFNIRNEILFKYGLNERKFDDSIFVRGISSLLKEEVREKNWLISFDYYRSRKNTSGRLKQYLESGYTLMEFRVRINSSTYKEKFLTYNVEIDNLNRAIKVKWEGFIKLYLINQKNKSQALQGLYKILRLTDSNIKKASVYRSLY